MHEKTKAREITPYGKTKYFEEGPFRRGMLL